MLNGHSNNSSDHERRSSEDGFSSKELETDAYSCNDSLYEEAKIPINGKKSMVIKTAHD